MRLQVKADDEDGKEYGIAEAISSVLYKSEGDYSHSIDLRGTIEMLGRLTEVLNDRGLINGEEVLTIINKPVGPNSDRYRISTAK
jgi:hypothetical protein